MNDTFSGRRTQRVTATNQASSLVLQAVHFYHPGTYQRSGPYQIEIAVRALFLWTEDEIIMLGKNLERYCVLLLCTVQ